MALGNAGRPFEDQGELEAGATKERCGPVGDERVEVRRYRKGF